MILACPECRTAYEVASGAFPAGGRDVECHKCGHVWFAAANGAGARGQAGGSRKRAVARIAALTAALALVAGGLVYARTGIVRLLPGTGALYAALGMPVNLRGLEFRDTTVETEIEDGLTILSVRGEIVNLTDTALTVPAIRYSIRDTAGLEIYHWLGVAGAAELPPGGRAVFFTRLASPPIAGEHIQIRFSGDEDTRKGGL